MLLQLLRPYVQPRDHVVEIGCGIGCTVGQFQRAGYCASGIEPNDGFRGFGIEKLGISIYAGVLTDLPRRPLADVILLVHVLEHLPSPNAALAHIRTLLRAGGLCYLEVPNAGAPHAAPGRMFHYAHIHNFTRDTICMLAAKNRLAVAQWLSSPQDKNLRVLLQCRESSEWEVVPGSYARAARAVAPRGALAYYLRWSYLRQRVATMMGHGGDRVLSAWRLKRIMRGRLGRRSDELPVPQLPSMACRRG
jgi:SAM-dependent methyltransferase